MFNEPIPIEATFAQFPNLRALRFFGTLLPVMPNLGGDEDIFPALQCLFLDQVAVDGCDRSPFTTFLARCASSGNRLDALEISGFSHMCTEVEEIRSVVGYSQTEGLKVQLRCPFETCPKS